ncbi:sugar 3,4-ketoisomerase [Flavobacterium crassostreae]|uniref:Sugar 3,4-ketoisomerase QdtA cupin domain-containing protein n=1 Tax=Flavobacterium crassostreae TaxID=1763534 RepID=A0A1B9E3D9_9FLAO|nr:FdtA/QdtA family cupin domain-containing protein [Flavobacterium crassostreae]OCB76462.1 hypothetical protein LPBF_05855 [Flavobacterium crassostreae]
MNARLIEIPNIENALGNLGVVEKDTLPFEVKRVYYLYDTPNFAERGGHSHKDLTQVLIAVSGSFDVILKDGTSQKKITLDKPNIGLLIHKNIWGELINFSSGAVCLVFASAVFDESDYIRDYAAFLEYLKTINS